MTKAVILGVANLSESNFEKIVTIASDWQLTLLDKDEKVIRKLQNKKDTILKTKKQNRQQVNNTYEAYAMRIEPQDCHAIVYADILLLCITKKDFSESLAYLKEVLSMRASTNSSQKLCMACLSDVDVRDIKQALLKDMNEALTSWFMQEVIFDDCLLSNEEQF